ncbi:MAG: hypothetical protein IID08_03005 [Candidatus Hydrogenedentes bacterium]|nr:hypothetical protein [Candidatus Hydrogenedentota bacterium]
MAPPKKLKRVVALDGHRLGLISGTAIALVVMGVSFFYQHAEFSATGIRTGWAFVAGYGATFFLVRVILRTTLFEFLDYDYEEKDSKATSRLGRTERDEEEESLASPPVTLAPHELLAQQAGGLTSSSEGDAPVETDETEASDEMDVQHLNS